MSDQAIQIIISVVTMLIALGVGLYLRRLLVRGLKKTVLDNWLIQLLGILVIISLIIVGTIVALFINGISLTHIFGYIQGSFTRNLIASALIILLAIGLGRTLMKLATAGVAKNHISINIRILLGRICYVVVM